VCAQDARAIGSLVFQAPTDFEKNQVLFMPGNGCGGEKAGRPMAEMSLANRSKGSLGAVHEVRARAAVHVQINISRQQIAAFQIDMFLGCPGRQSVFGLDLGDAIAGDPHEPFYNKAASANYCPTGEKEPGHFSAGTRIPSN
jgi:hypothetical protein